MNTQKKSDHHITQFTKICLSEECNVPFLICQEGDLTVHKHSKTQISQIKDIRKKLKDAWQPKQSAMDGYIKKSRLFYQNLKKQIIKLIDEDQRTVQNILGKLRYHHLPVEANSSAYIEFMKFQYDRLDKRTILTLLNQAQNGQQNKDMQKVKQISNFLQSQLKKTGDKVLTLKYVLLSKKLQTEMLLPKLSEPSKVADQEQFIRVYSLFNSRKMLIRSVKLVYRASQHEFSPVSFYNNCIDSHNCLALVKGKNNKVYGGFSPVPLVYHDQEELGQSDIYQKDDTKKSFIFSISNLKSYSIKDSQKAVLYKKEQEGPCFGVDLQISRQLTSSLGHSYESPEGVQVDSLESKVYLFEADNVEVADFQIWQISF